MDPVERDPVGREPTGREVTRRIAVAAAGALLLAGCASPAALTPDDGRLQVVTTTGLLADLVRNVGGDLVRAVALVPDGADPHGYEPTLRDAADAAHADVAFSNYALQEPRGVIRTLEANLRPQATHVSLAEESAKYAAELIPLIENANLDTIWLGVRAQGAGAAYGADPSSEVLFTVTAVDGPGDVFAYLTGTFGDTDVYLDSSDGFDAAGGYLDDTMTLPLDAHTHLSWAFTEPGVYTLDAQARVQAGQSARPVPVDEARFVFAVGVDPARAQRPDAAVLDSGHADLTVDLDGGRLEVRYDAQGGTTRSATAADAHGHSHGGGMPFAPDEVVIAVPSRALDEVPDGRQFAFLGAPGSRLYQLPQAVLGRNVHGEIDPHLLQNVRNAMAYTQLIRDTLVDADPEHAREYRANADAYLAELTELDDDVRERLADIPEEHRDVVTTHAAFGYLADAYGLRVAGTVTPTPSVEASLADRRKLAETIRTLEVPAVFLEPHRAGRTSTLADIARGLGIAVCPLYGDTLDGTVGSYIELMRFNAESLHDCLTPVHSTSTDPEAR
ncbi:anchored repeat ABC transporter substrate-binding protein [Diaminobutyricimonas aerilata]|uniref:Anchored repeat ABC transporter substrate-binding protein n=1 Tax=Diaminobutyricimonas aerilata TaxID=1162967 RepID=A0A2M9CM69_9MICO|nr:anchored repeat ABC transporter, substrate-binding protein [Diaminobutyricimonas aerilata]PJJ72997.1 anchored repeat ABC transporter substrate-binding protein [Diaminobutyricimonas aerilata]